MTMPLEKQVVSLPLAKRLKELGVKQGSLWNWLEASDGARLMRNPVADLYSRFDQCAAFTVAELGEMFPDIPHYRLRIEKIGSSWGVQFRAVSYDAPHGELLFAWAEPTEADVRAKMLIHLLESGIIRNKE